MPICLRRCLQKLSELGASVIQSTRTGAHVSKDRLVLTPNPPEPLRLSEQICKVTLRSLCCISQALERKHKLATCQVQIQGYISGQERISRQTKADICLHFWGRLDNIKDVFARETPICCREGKNWDTN